MKLKSADAGKRAGRGANFGRIVRERGDIVAVERDGIGELAAGNLHPVAGISGEADDRVGGDFAPRFYLRNFRSSGHPVLSPRCCKSPKPFPGKVPREHASVQAFRAPTRWCHGRQPSRSSGNGRFLKTGKELKRTARTYAFKDITTPEHESRTLADQTRLDTLSSEVGRNWAR